MPKSKYLSSYPSDYFQLFEKVLVDGSYTTPPAPAKEIKALMLDLYGFRGALRNEEHPSAREFDAIKLTTPKAPNTNGRKLTLHLEVGSYVGLLGDLGPEVRTAPFYLTPETPSKEVTDTMDSTIADLFSKPEGDSDADL